MAVGGLGPPVVGLEMGRRSGSDGSDEGLERIMFSEGLGFQGTKLLAVSGLGFREERMPTVVSATPFSAMNRAGSVSDSLASETFLMMSGGNSMAINQSAHQQSGAKVSVARDFSLSHLADSSLSQVQRTTELGLPSVDASDPMILEASHQDSSSRIQSAIGTSSLQHGPGRAATFDFSRVFEQAPFGVSARVNVRTADQQGMNAIPS
ncbi:hypothetical protein NE237_023903 [Protea cynaroides]|uniref:Uncharacterized protein n=1 Tax=Protea cynaroides TaxID=273540 RepID=A0A9Q0K4W9_9MAGN|nr:hypothetical protein NE237_023903 [Protea cynaroides]